MSDWTKQSNGRQGPPQPWGTVEETAIAVIFTFLAVGLVAIIAVAVLQ